MGVVYAVGVNEGGATCFADESAALSPEDFASCFPGYSNVGIGRTDPVAGGTISPAKTFFLQGGQKTAEGQYWVSFSPMYTTTEDVISPLSGAKTIDARLQTAHVPVRDSIFLDWAGFFLLEADVVPSLAAIPDARRLLCPEPVVNPLDLIPFMGYLSEADCAYV